MAILLESIDEKAVGAVFLPTGFFEWTRVKCRGEDMTKKIRNLVMGVLFLFGIHLAFPQEYPPGFSFVQVPNPLSGINPVYQAVPMTVPQVGVPFFDARFGTLLTRVTSISGIEGRHEYSRFDPFNRDQSVVILDPEFLWRFYSTQSIPYNQGTNLVLSLIHI